jgi:hypothetical protein
MTRDDPAIAALGQVIATHSERLMAIDGVTGLAVGLLPDGRTPCVKILVEKLTEQLETRLPATLEGHPVVIETSGEIRPLDGR